MSAGRAQGALLEITGLSAWYGRQQVLRDVDLRIMPGEVVGLFGHNGAGKTTLVKSIIGYEVRCSGSIRFKGKEILGQRPSSVINSGVGITPQGVGIFGTLSVAENITFGTREGRQERRIRARAVADELSVVGDRWDDLGDRLSGGQRQIVSIGRELTKSPELLLLDEPSVGLAPKIVSQTMELVGRLQAGGAAALLIEQNIPSARSVITRGYVVRQGEIVFEGAPADFDDAHALVKYF